MLGFCSNSVESGQLGVSLGQIAMKKDFRTKNLLSQFALDPKFIEVWDCIVLADASVELLPYGPLQTPEERRRTEYGLNRRDVWELFEVPPRGTVAPVALRSG
jgi:hypothetical protein